MYLGNVVFVQLALFLATAFGLNIELDDAWAEYKRVYKKEYPKDLELLRRLVWEDNIKAVQKHNLETNRGRHNFRMGENEYSDMSASEFRAVMNGYSMKNHTVAEFYKSDTKISDLPSSVDWREKGYVTEIKNQMQCGSCWAFSATGALEGQTFKKTGKLVSLSEQNLVDCSKKQGNQGCQGGLPSYAFTYIKDNKGVDKEESYPYKAKNGKCKFTTENIGATDKGYRSVFKGFEHELQKAVAEVGPISVGIDASHGSFQQYKSGIYSEGLCSRSHLDHAVLVVGYGSQDGSDYWIVKNSWGTSWGMNGYFLLARNQHNMCGVATDATYPIV